MPRYTRQGRTILIDGKPAIAIKRELDDKNNNPAGWGPAKCDAVAQFICDALNAPTFDLETVYRKHMES